MNMITKIESDTATEPSQETPRPRSTTWRRAAWGVGAVALVAAGYGVVHRPSPAMAVQGPPVVTVANPLQRNVMEWDNYVGRFEPSRSVEIRPRVSGAIVGIHFTDGQIVRAGQPLFTIDPRPYAAALASKRRSRSPSVTVRRCSRVVPTFAPPNAAWARILRASASPRRISIRRFHLADRSDRRDRTSLTSSRAARSAGWSGR